MEDKVLHRWTVTLGVLLIIGVYLDTQPWYWQKLLSHLGESAPFMLNAIAWVAVPALAWLLMLVAAVLFVSSDRRNDKKLCTASLLSSTLAVLLPVSLHLQGQAGTEIYSGWDGLGPGLYMILLLPGILVALTGAVAGAVLYRAGAGARESARAGDMGVPSSVAERGHGKPSAAAIAAIVIVVLVDIAGMAYSEYCNAEAAREFDELISRYEEKYGYESFHGLDGGSNADDTGSGSHSPGGSDDGSISDMGAAKLRARGLDSWERGFSSSYGGGYDRVQWMSRVTGISWEIYVTAYSMTASPRGYSKVLLSDMDGSDADYIVPDGGITAEVLDSYDKDTLERIQHG